MSQQIRLESQISPTSSGQRFDQVVSELFPQYSRARLQGWIRAGELRLAGKVVKPNTKVLGGESVLLETQLQSEGSWEPQAMDLDVAFEDEHILVINKAAGIVVHPAAGNPDGTLLNALLHHAPQLEAVPRAGIVHRLDKDTSGLMVVAKTLEAQTHLVKQLQARTVSRQYEAIAVGAVPAEGTVDAPIGRHPRQRKKMAVVDLGGKEAITHYRVVERYTGFTRIKVKLETGRTHQIRVHMAHLKHPLVGDPVYGGRVPSVKGAAWELTQAVRSFPRQALHAAQLGLLHPHSGRPMQWRASVPQDMAELMAVLSEHSAEWSDD